LFFVVWFSLPSFISVIRPFICLKFHSRIRDCDVSHLTL
jgi:hypothetical protein